MPNKRARPNDPCCREDEEYAKLFQELVSLPCSLSFSKVSGIPPNSFESLDEFVSLFPFHESTEFIRSLHEDDQQFIDKLYSHICALVSRNESLMGIMSNVRPMKQVEINFRSFKLRLMYHWVMMQQFENQLTEFGLKPRSLPDHAVSIMAEWMANNGDHPYPTQEEKRKFAKLGQIELRQVDNWFVNSRYKTKHG